MANDMHPSRTTVNATYGSTNLAVRLLEDLHQSGRDLDKLCTDDLRPFDELHVMGREATLELGQLAGLTQGMRVLDLGSGLGGPARTLAQGFGCHVTGIDLSREFVTAAIVLSRCVGLARQVTFSQGDALKLPFAGQQFDAVFMIHLSMNIGDKDALFTEARRVLKKGGRLLLWEICRGDAPGMIFPVPWAQDPSFSYLIDMAEMTATLKRCGLASLLVQDATDPAAAWIRARQSASKNKSRGKPRLNLNLILEDFRLKRVNISKNLLQGCIRVVRASATKP